jgi:hypothetical protein
LKTFGFLHHSTILISDVHFFFDSRNSGDSTLGEEHDLFAGHGADAVLHGRGQDASEADQDQIVD